MKSILTSVITCALLFGGSLFVTQFLLEPDPSEQVETTNASASGSESTQKKATDSKVTLAKRPVQLPTALRPDNAVSIETVLQMSNSIRKMEQALIEREKRVIKEEQRVQTLVDDLTTEQSELRAFNEGIDAKVEMLARLAKQVEEDLNQLDSRKSELELLAKQTGSDDESKQADFDAVVKEVKDWFSSLDPEQAALHLRGLANQGKLELASSLLSEMQARQQSKILTAMDDPVFVNQLIDGLKLRRKPGTN